MKRTNVAAAAMGAAALAAVGIAVATMGTAHAGSNGQQVRICINGGDYAQITVDGNNQSDQLVEVSLPVAAGEDGCTPVSEHWWKGDIRVIVTGSTSGEFREVIQRCFVPTEQSDSDSVDCSVAAARPGPPLEPTPQPSPSRTG